MNGKEKIVVNLVLESMINTSISTEDSSNSEIDWNNSSLSIDDTSFSSEENDGYLLLFPLMKYLISGCKRHRVEDYLHVVDSWTDLEFKEHLRIKRNLAIRLIDELHESGFIPSHSFGVRPIEAKLSFLIFLWHLANTESLRTISDRFDVSISSVFRVIRRVTAWILIKLDDVIKWPEGQHVAYVCHQFYAKRGIPNIMGAIDCTQIKIEKPNVENARDYCNRKKYFSVSLQAVVDAHMKFTNIYCGQPGSLHDARVLRKSVLYNSVNEHREVIFPDEKFIIGDSAYPSLQWLVPPFRDNGHLTLLQTEFNFILSSTRMAVEKTFGYLKGRFRRIKFFSECREMPFITNTIVAACILHNLCLNYDDDSVDYDDVEMEELNDNIYDNVNENINFGHQVDRRMQLLREIFDQE
ncbi:protein ALP1-like [Harpegnathos saltator]|uniref:protein ALP1-like n=1 Tax=Harpegnathos saltator TaxID=610380 RepID=UPI000DBEED11|nr:protein ALP1-like [Harpegnathos saltator]XP_025156258.1 protein ALP1-like [Harpegnathos saltator]